MDIRDQTFAPVHWMSTKIITKDASNNKPTLRYFYANDDFTNPVFKWIITYDENDEIDKFQSIIL